MSTLAVNGATSREMANVKDVSFSNQGDSLEARIIATEDSKYTHFELSDPRRLVVDFHGIQNAVTFKEKRIDSEGVERVRASFFSDQTRSATRIVFDLAKDVRYRIIDDGGGIVRVVFGETARAPRNQTAGPVIVAQEQSPLAVGAVSGKLNSLVLAEEPGKGKRLLRDAADSPLPSVPVSVTAPRLSLLVAVDECDRDQPASPDSSDGRSNRRRRKCPGPHPRRRPNIPVRSSPSTSRITTSKTSSG